MGKGSDNKGCEWVAKDTSRGSKKSSDKVLASDECILSCDSCPTACEMASDSTSWVKSGSPEKGCEWVALKPNSRCNKNGETAPRPLIPASSPATPVPRKPVR